MQALDLIKELIDGVSSSTTEKVFVENDGDDYEIETVEVDVKGDICLKITVPKCPCCESVDQITDNSVLKRFSTKELTEELERRAGIRSIRIGPEDNVSIVSDQYDEEYEGPVVLLINQD